MSGWLEANIKLGESQVGFRETRGTRDHVCVLNSLINRRLKRKNGKLYTCLEDFRTASDSIDRGVLREKIEKKTS